MKYRHCPDCDELVSVRDAEDAYVMDLAGIGGSNDTAAEEEGHMECPECHAENPAWDEVCEICDEYPCECD